MSTDMIDAAELLRRADAAPGATVTLSKDQFRTVALELVLGNAARATLAHADRIEAAIDDMIARPAARASLGHRSPDAAVDPTENRQF